MELDRLLEGFRLLRESTLGPCPIRCRHVECRGRISVLLTERGQPTRVCPTFSDQLAGFPPGAHTLCLFHRVLRGETTTEFSQHWRERRRGGGGHHSEC